MSQGEVVFFALQLCAFCRIWCVHTLNTSQRGALRAVAGRVHA